MEIKGTLVKVTDPKAGTSKNGNNWLKAFAILESEGPYPKKIAIVLMKEDLILRANQLKVGQLATFQVNAQSREYNENWTSDLTAWRVE